MTQSIFSISNLNINNSISLICNLAMQNPGGYGPAGDFNGDGIPDFVLKNYIIFGSKSLPSIVDFSSGLPMPSSLGLRLIGAPNSINFLNDINFDGKGDLHYYDGSSAIYFGTNVAPIISSAPQSISGTFAYSASSISSKCGVPIWNFTGNGINNYATGCGNVVTVTTATANATEVSGDVITINNGAGPISPLGDFNGDGMEDIALGVPGGIGVVFGNKIFPAQFDAINLNGMNGFTTSGMEVEKDLNYVPSHNGDVNGDGLKDLFFVGRSTIGDATTALYILYGTKMPMPAAIDRSYFNGTAGFTIIGSGAQIELGTYFDFLPDINNDGMDEVMISSSHTNGYTGYCSGGIYIIYGSKNMQAVLDISQFNAPMGFIISGSGNCLNYAMSIGDVDADGKQDILLMNENWQTGVTNANVIFLEKIAASLGYGPTTTTTTTNTSTSTSTSTTATTTTTAPTTIATTTVTDTTTPITALETTAITTSTTVPTTVPTTVTIGATTTDATSATTSSTTTVPITVATGTSTTTSNSTATITLTIATKTTSSAFFSTVSQNVSASGNATEDSSNNSDNNARSGLSIAEMAGIAIGAFVFVVAAGYLIYKKFHMNHNKVLDGSAVEHNGDMHTNPIYNTQLPWDKNNYEVCNVGNEYLEPAADQYETYYGSVGRAYEKPVIAAGSSVYVLDNYEA